MAFVAQIKFALKPCSADCARRVDRRPGWRSYFRTGLEVRRLGYRPGSWPGGRQGEVMAQRSALLLAVACVLLGSPAVAAEWQYRWDGHGRESCGPSGRQLRRASGSHRESPKHGHRRRVHNPTFRQRRYGHIPLAASAPANVGRQLDDGLPPTWGATVCR